MSKATRKDPQLWEQVKEEITQSDKGGNTGQWSARKAQMAVQEYKKRGGRYEGQKKESNDLHQWTKEDWGTKSGKKSTETGERYLPKKARETISDEEYRRTTEKKRADSNKGKQYSDQPDDVARKTAPYRKGGDESGKDRTKRELMEKAVEHDIEGRSTMSKDELAKALAERGGGGRNDEQEPTKAELMEEARKRDLDGRSKMNKDELRDALGM